MDELRPNLVGGLLGLQQGLLEDHASMQHGGVGQDTKFMSFQDQRLMGIGGSHENRLLSLASSVQDTRSPITTLEKSSSSSLNHQRKCSSTPEDFSALYSGLPTPGMDSSSHHHTPAHTPPSRLSDHTISAEGRLQEAQAGTQQRPVDGFLRHHLARKRIIIAQPARRPHPNHSVLPHARPSETPHHIHTGTISGTGSGVRQIALSGYLLPRGAGANHQAERGADSSLVSEPAGQVPQAGEAAAEGAGTVCDPILQRDDAQHPGLQRLARLSAVSAPQHHESLSPGMSPEDEWYNKSLSALRMNSSHHPNLSAPMLQYQT
ncbi:GM22737 [Drosophila sechellia]|uniref:GM22737 n=1 Tax=Drosophila sechellia TaxID=7238 RepID=B4I764_DROSE|nr:GM22737 [Drosophila sechellia]